MTLWNELKTDAQEGMIVETISIRGHNGDSIHAYTARPTGSGPFASIVLTHHLSGWDEFFRETARRFAQHGYAVVCPDLHCRVGHGSPDDVAAKVRGDGGLADASAIGDLEGAMKYLKGQPYSNGKVGIIGMCSGARYSYLTACSVPGFDAVGDLWGGAVAMAPDQLDDKRPVAPIDLTRNLQAPLLGLFGNDDQAPSPDEVNQHEAELKKHGKHYEFHRYDGARHGFFYYDRPAYRQEQAMDGWNKVFEFFGRHLQS